MIIRVMGCLAAMAVVVLAGCNGEPADVDEPVTLPDLTTAPVETTTPTPTAEPPVEPQDVHEYSADGVEAFTMYAIDVINHAYQTNDVTYLKQIMTDDCQTCANTVARLEEIEEAGGRVEGGQLVPGIVAISGPADGVQTSAGVELLVTASKTTNGQGRTTNTEVDREVYFIFNLAREGDRWKLDEVMRSSDNSS